MEPNVDRGMWSVVALLAAIVIGGVVLIAFPKISGKIANNMDDTVNKAFEGGRPQWAEDQGVEIKLSSFTKEFSITTLGDNRNKTFATLEKGIDEIAKEFEGGKLKIEYEFEIDVKAVASTDKMSRYNIQFQNTPYTITGGPQHDYYISEAGKHNQSNSLIIDMEHLAKSRPNADNSNIGFRMDHTVGDIKFKKLKFTAYYKSQYPYDHKTYEEIVSDINNRNGAKN